MYGGVGAGRLILPATRFGCFSTAKYKPRKHTPNERTERSDNGAHNVVPRIGVSRAEGNWKQNEQGQPWKLYDTGGGDNKRVVWERDVEPKQHEVDHYQN